MQPRASLAELALDASIFTLGLVAAVGSVIVLGLVGLPVALIVAIAAMRAARPIARAVCRLISRPDSPRARFDAATPVDEQHAVLLLAVQHCLRRGAPDDAAAFAREALRIDPSSIAARRLLQEMEEAGVDHRCEAPRAPASSS